MLERIVETKAGGDATTEELAIREVNTGIYVFDGGALLGALPRLRPDNEQGELYLPDVLSLLREEGATVAAHAVDDPAIVLGINDRVQLGEARELARRRIITGAPARRRGRRRPGVDADRRDRGARPGHRGRAVHDPARRHRRRRALPARSRRTLTNVTIGDEATVLHTYGIDAEIRDGASVGPFAYLRPGTLLRERSKVGTFVEIKNSDIGEGTKVPHLSYVGDADVGAGSNLGAGTITANYDGRRKHRTTIGTGVRGSVHVVLRRAGDGRRPGLHGGRLGDHRGRARRRARHRARAPVQHRRLRRAPRGAGGAGADMTELVPTLPGADWPEPEPRMNTSLPIDYDKRLMLFSGRANPELANKIADRLNVDLGPVTLKTFSNGEVYCRFEESIRGADVFIVQPTCGNPATGITANDALMELLVMIDAAVGASAHRVIAVTPWFGYSRQDKKSAPREPISARLVARMLESAGADRVLTMDLHAGQVQGFFNIPVDHMTAMFMLTQYFDDLGLQDLVVVSPDAGRVKLNKKFASKVGAELAILDKERPAQQVAEIGYVIGDVRGQDRRDRRRHDRHRRHAEGRRHRRSSTRAPRASSRRRRTRSSAATPTRTSPPPASSRSSSPTRSRCARARRTTSACSRAPTCSPTRSAGSSPTTP